MTTIKYFMPNSTVFLEYNYLNQTGARFPDFRLLPHFPI